MVELPLMASLLDALPQRRPLVRWVDVGSSCPLVGPARCLADLDQQRQRCGGPAHGGVSQAAQSSRIITAAHRHSMAGNQSRSPARRRLKTHHRLLFPTSDSPSRRWP